MITISCVGDDAAGGDTVRKKELFACIVGMVQGRKPADWQEPEALRKPWTWRGSLFRLAGPPSGCVEWVEEGQNAATGVWNWG